MQGQQDAVSLLSNIKTINRLLTTTHSPFLVQDTRVFYDEPPYYFFSGLLTNNLDYLSSQGYCSTKEHVVGGGISFVSRPFAVVKCFAELAERFSLFNFKPRIISKHPYDASLSMLNISYYLRNAEDSVLGWISAVNLSRGVEALVPAQLVYLNYFSDWAKKHNPKEPRLCQHISNGACFGFDRESTMLRGIYELIERDAAITLYLVKYRAPRIDIESIEDPTIIKCIKIAKQYEFKIFVFDMSNDLEIPTFLTILIDESGVGPRLTTGLKTSLNPVNAIIGSMEEAFMGRTWVRHELMSGAPKKSMSTNITNRLERALLYATQSGYNNLQYLLRSPKKRFSHVHKRYNSPKIELNSLVKNLTKKGFTIFAADICPELFLKESCFLYRMIIPEFQQFYLSEIDKSINEKRLNDVRSYFHIPKQPIPTFPHPYL